MGLLDMLNDDTGLLGLNLLAAAGPQARPMSFGQRLLGGMNSYKAELTAAEERKQKKAMQELQMGLLNAQIGETQAQGQQRQAAMQQSQKDDELLRQQFSPMAGPTQDQAPLMPLFDPRSMLGGGASGPSVMQAMKLNSAMQPPKPEAFTLSPGQQRFAGDKVVAAVPEKPAEAPSAVREYEYGKVDGAFNDWLLRGKRAGATNIGMPKIELKMGEGVATQVGPMLKSSREMAEAGIRLVDSSSRVLDAADNGNLYAGPMANLRLKGAQVADLFGIAGKDTQEKITNTRSVVRGMAEQAVSARAQLGGQAQISNTEQELLTKATSGDISELTVSEVAQIAKLNDRLGRLMYGNHERQLGVMKQRPELQNIAPFYEVPPIQAPRKGATAGNWDDEKTKRYESWKRSQGVQ